MDELEKAIQNMEQSWRDQCGECVEAIVDSNLELVLRKLKK